MYLDDWTMDHANSPAKKKPKVTSEVTSTPTTLYGSAVREMTAHATHNQTVLLPNAGDDGLRHRVRSYVFTHRMWMVEGDLKRYERIMQDYIECPSKRPWDTNYDLDTVWFMQFLDWSHQFDPEGTQADVAILNSAPDLAAAELVEAWKFVRPHGSITAILPARELFEEQEMHDWLADRWCDYAMLHPDHYSKQHHPLQLCSVYLTRCYSIETGELM